MWTRTDCPPKQDPFLELASRLPPDSPIRLWQEHAPADDEDTGMELLQALVHCHRSDWASHAVALLALDALARAGEGSAAHAVKRLMKRTASERVRERAASLLPVLIDRAAHNRQIR